MWRQLILELFTQHYYNVSSSYSIREGNFGFEVGITSKYKPVYLENIILEFLKSLRIMVEDMDAAEYQSHINSLIADRLEKYQSLDEEFYDYWASISNGFYEFNHAENDIHHLRSITKTDLLQFYDQFISPFSSSSSSLSIHLESQIVPTQQDPIFSTKLIYPVLIYNKICRKDMLNEHDLKNMISEYEKKHGTINESTIRKFLKSCQDRELISPFGSQMLDDTINKIKNGFSSLSSFDHTRLPEGYIVFDNIIKFKMQMLVSAAPTPLCTFQYP